MPSTVNRAKRYLNIADAALEVGICLVEKVFKLASL